MSAFGRRPNPVFGDEYKVLRDVLVDARREAGLSQRALAARLGKAKSHIGMIERGQRRVDALELYHLALCLGRDPCDLFSAIALRLRARGARAPEPGARAG